MKSPFIEENSPLVKVGSQMLVDPTMMNDNQSYIKKLRGAIQTNSKISAPTSRQDNLSKVTATKV